MPENRILLVEDEPTTREILAEVLRTRGYSVDTVATAGAAATCLKAIPYALVIADWVLPDGDGIDVADAAAELGSKTVVISGYTADFPAGAAERHQLFAKPLQSADLVVAVEKAIGPVDDRE
jgi:CheY-like chemotaxis protein